MPSIIDGDFEDITEYEAITIQESATYYPWPYQLPPTICHAGRTGTCVVKLR